MAPAAVRALRVALGENVATFGARFAVSGRTVEDWEQGRHAPRGLAARVLRALAVTSSRGAACAACGGPIVGGACAVCYRPATRKAHAAARRRP